MRLARAILGASLAVRVLGSGPAACARDDGEGEVALLQVHGQRPLRSTGEELNLAISAEEADNNDLPAYMSGLQAPGAGSALDLNLMLDDHSSKCETVFLTTLLSTRHDPQRAVSITPNFTYIEAYYRSILSLPGGRAKAVILYDSLDEDMTSKYEIPDAISFVKVDISNMDPLLGLNDLRYQLFEDQIRKHPEWDTVFMTDSRDVVVLHNPCVLVERQPEKVFVGSQTESMKPRWWFNESFHGMGGKYLDWYEAQPNHTKIKLSAGIMGGKRDLVLLGLESLNAVLTDPELELRKKGRQVAVNMAAFNYVFHGEFDDDTVTGFPLHSKWNYWENRTDVYFWHH